MVTQQAPNPFATKTPMKKASNLPVTTGSVATTKTRKTPNRAKNPEETKYIIQEYVNKGKHALAAELGLTIQQVYRTIMDARTNVMKMIEETSDPDKKEKLQNLLDTKLILSGKTGGGRSKGNTVNNVLDELLA